MSRSNPFKEIMNEDLQRFEAHSERIGEAIQRTLSQSALVTNPFKLIMNEQVEAFEPMAERIREAVERDLLRSKTVSNPFKLVMDEQAKAFAPHAARIQEAVERELLASEAISNPFKLVLKEHIKAIEPQTERIQRVVSHRLSSSAALGDMLKSYLQSSMETFFTFNSTIIEGIGMHLKLASGKSLAAITVKVYEYLAAERLKLGEQVPLLAIDGIFNSYKPIDIVFNLPFDEDHVSQILPRQLATIFRQVQITEFRIVKLQQEGIKLRLEMPEEDAPRFIQAFEAGKFKAAKLAKLEVIAEKEEVFPIPFEKDVQQIIANIEVLLDQRKLGEALENCILLLSNYRLIRPQSQVFSLQGSYTYVNTNRATLAASVVALEEDRITQALRSLLNSLH